MDELPQTTINLLAGPQLIGVLLNWALLGMLIVQTYIYHVSFPNDPLRLRLFVYYVLIFEVVQTGLLSSVSFRYFVTDFGDDAGLYSYYSGWFSVCAMCGIMSATVQCYFGWRLWVLSKNYILVGCIILIALEQMSMAIVSGVKLKQLSSSLEEATVTPFIDAWLAGSALVDTIIAVSMTVFFSRAKAGMAALDALLDRLIVLVIGTGTLTAIVDLCLFTIMPKTYLHVAPVLTLSKLYANTLLINFNSRAFKKREDNIKILSTFRPYHESNITDPNHDSTTLGLEVNETNEIFTDNSKNDTIILTSTTAYSSQDERLAKTQPASTTASV